MRKCKDAGIKRVGFSGGEPFLVPDFLCRLTKEAVSLGMLFDRIMTNGAWFGSEAAMRRALERLRRSGYDGAICVSADAFHSRAGSERKVAGFIRAATSIWGRPDMVSIACVTGARDKATGSVLRKIAALLGARILKRDGRTSAIRNRRLFIRILYIDIAPIGGSGLLKRAWGARWFEDDRCRGPGNVFYVLPDGSVKPCCGYATGSERLTIGNIGRDSPSQIMRNAQANSYIRTVFGQGLGAIRRVAEKAGYRFPGKAGNICFFCDYVLNKMPGRILEECLKRVS